MYYILDASGKFLHSIDNNEGMENWTDVALPQPCWNPVFVGSRNKTGEWIGKWHHDGRPVPTIDELIARIEEMADAARKKIAGDPLRAIEYDEAVAEAVAFKDAGYPEDAVPRAVAAWAIGGLTIKESADSILREAERYTESLNVISERRFEGKEQVHQAIAKGEIDTAEKITNETVAAIQIAAAGNNLVPTLFD